MQIYRKRYIQKGLPSVGSLPKWPQWLELSQSQSRSQEPPGLPRGCRVPRLWAVLHCFPGHRQGAGWEGGAAGTRGLLALQGEDLAAEPSCQAPFW